VLHRCDTPRCVNVEHLELGTQKENIAQAVERKRHRNARKITCKRGTQRFASLIAIKPKGGIRRLGGAADWQHKDGEGQGINHVLAHREPPKKRSRNFSSFLKTNARLNVHSGGSALAARHLPKFARADIVNA
jgi:hypothetical protein